ncbi:hypothetical protein JVU11DRAFT_6182 [Chiua virens]|nr:hypothetical protein JVU11DRAFT_6182 [Chiua virens]
MSFQQQPAMHSQNYMVPKFNAGYPSYPPQTPNQPSQSHSISPTQLLSANPNQLIPNPAQPLTLTPAQLLQQQQGIPPIAHMNMPIQPNMSMHIPTTPNHQQNSPMRMPFQPGMNQLRYPQLTPQERAALQRQQQAAGLTHPIPADRAPGTPTPHERGLSLTHERPPSQHDRALADRQSSHDRAPSQPHDIPSIQADRPSSSASVRSHHSHPAHESSQLPMMPPPSSRPGTASGPMSTPSRMNHNQHPMNLNPNMNAVSLTSNINLMNPHMAPQPQQMVTGPPQLNPAAMHMAGGTMGIPMNRPPTRTGSAPGHGSPKHSPRMSLGPMGGAPGVGPSVGMGGLAPGVQGGMPNNMVGGMGVTMGGAMGAPMASNNMGNMGGHINGNINMAMGPQGMSAMQGMAGMGSLNMNPPTPASLVTGGNMMVSAGGALMGPPVLPQGMQRPDREPMMQPHMREPSVPVSRETVSMMHPPDGQAYPPQSLPPTSTAPFMGLDNTGMPTMGPNIPNMPRQGSQPPPPQSPARQIPAPHRSPMAPIRKIGEIPGPAGTPPVNVPPIPGTTPGQKLPPHIASLNPAVTKISYIPYIIPPKASDATDATSDENKKPSSEEATTDTDKDGASEDNPPAKIEDPVPMLTPSEIATLREVMALDSAYDTVYRAKQARMLQESRTAGPGGRLAWWDRDFAANSGINRRPDRFDVRYPRPPRTDGMAPRRKGARREGIRMSVPLLFVLWSRSLSSFQYDRPGKLPNELANRPEQLVPIRLEFDVEHHKMRETFVWNLNGQISSYHPSFIAPSSISDPVITPEMFAQTLVEDYSLAPTYHSVITKSIQEQLSDFKAHMASIDTDWRPPTVEISQSEGPGAEEPEDSDVEVVPRPQQPAPEHDVDADASRMDQEEDVIVGRGTLDEEAVQWWESWRKRAKKEMPRRKCRPTDERNARSVPRSRTLTRRAGATSTTRRNHVQ